MKAIPAVFLVEPLYPRNSSILSTKRRKDEEAAALALLCEASRILWAFCQRGHENENSSTLDQIAALLDLPDVPLPALRPGDSVEVPRLPRREPPPHRLAALPSGDLRQLVRARARDHPVAVARRPRYVRASAGGGALAWPSGAYFSTRSGCRVQGPPTGTPG